MSEAQAPAPTPPAMIPLPAGCVSASFRLAGDNTILIRPSGDGYLWTAHGPCCAWSETSTARTPGDAIAAGAAVVRRRMEIVR